MKMRRWIKDIYKIWGKQIPFGKMVADTLWGTSKDGRSEFRGYFFEHIYDIKRFAPNYTKFLSVQDVVDIQILGLSNEELHEFFDVQLKEATNE